MYKTASEIADYVLVKCAAKKKVEKKRESLFSEYGTRSGDIRTPLYTFLGGRFMRSPLLGAAIGAGVSAPEGEGVGRAGGAALGAAAGGMGAGLGAMGIAKLLKMKRGDAAKLVSLLNMGGTMAGASAGNRQVGRSYAEMNERKKKEK